MDTLIILLFPTLALTIIVGYVVMKRVEQRVNNKLYNKFKELRDE
jgi:hypothetical protein